MFRLSRKVVYGLLALVGLSTSYHVAQKTWHDFAQATTPYVDTTGIWSTAGNWLGQAAEKWPPVKEWVSSNSLWLVPVTLFVSGFVFYFYGRKKTLKEAGLNALATASPTLGALAGAGSHDPQIQALEARIKELEAAKQPKPQALTAYDRMRQSKDERQLQEHALETATWFRDGFEGLEQQLLLRQQQARRANTDVTEAQEMLMDTVQAQSDADEALRTAKAEVAEAKQSFADAIIVLTPEERKRFVKLKAYFPKGLA